MTTLTEAVRRFLKYQDEWDTMASRRAYRALQSARKDPDALLAEPAAPQAEPIDEQIANIAAMHGVNPPLVSYEKVIKVVRAVLALRPAPVAEPAASDAPSPQDISIVKTQIGASTSAMEAFKRILAAAEPPQPVAQGNEREAFEAAWQSGEIERPEHQRRRYSADDIETAERMVAISAWQARAARSKREEGDDQFGRTSEMIRFQNMMDAGDDE